MSIIDMRRMPGHRGVDSLFDAVAVPLDQAMAVAERVARAEWMRVAAERRFPKLQATQLFNVFWATVEMQEMTRSARDRRRPPRRR